MLEHHFFRRFLEAFLELILYHFRCSFFVTIPELKHFCYQWLTCRANRGANFHAVAASDLSRRAPHAFAASRMALAHAPRDTPPCVLHRARPAYRILAATLAGLSRHGAHIARARVPSLKSPNESPPRQHRWRRGLPGAWARVSVCASQEGSIPHERKPSRMAPNDKGRPMGGS